MSHCYRIGARLSFGKADDASITRIGRHVQQQHCVFAQRAGCYYVQRSDSQAALRVNRQAIEDETEHELTGDEILFIAGEYYFQFVIDERQGARTGWLIEVERVDGLELTIENLEVSGSLRIAGLRIPRGKLTAIHGPSGCGKTTLLKLLADPKFNDYHGSIQVDGRELRGCRTAMAQAIGYVEQHSTAHGHLTPRQAIECQFALRQPKLHQLQDAEWMLKRLGLEGCAGHPIDSCSGGEQKRVNAALEILAKPRLLLLDEPGSGLDEETERKLLRVLRGLCCLGCTVVVVTHNLHLEGLYDDKIALEKYSEPPREFPYTWRNPRPLGGSIGQVWQLWARECLAAWSNRFSRLLLPLLVLPAFFAAAIALAVPDLQTLGFLSLLICFWMGASGSLLSIAGERRIYEHEKLTFLRVIPYSLSKILFHSVFSSIQAACFLAILAGIRAAFGENLPPANSAADAFFYGWHGFHFILPMLLVAWTGVGVGLFLSALAKDKPNVANMLLPLVMVGQVVFSFQVSGNATMPSTDSQRRLVMRPLGEANSKYAERFVNLNGFVNGTSRWLTIRSADEILRSFAYAQEDWGNYQNSGQAYKETRCAAYGRLSLLCLLAHLAALGCLVIQDTVVKKHRHDFSTWRKTSKRR